ncbi:lef-4 [Adoxophyes orana granulovirus]|uniref:Late expression factor 4 n=1 Tax=Adoxophyes orana granulovirus TaxID=170617 RepID=Q7T9T5_GVAO|nr:lef-4 [Adoxophyes orana granulovirus]AAP85717.1 lef-4 [Adoxophyes orana granulovirus]AJA91720.1 late expression factor 4 [Adoxophyes orana granulovirus]
MTFNCDNNCVKEQEIAYTFAYSQDVIYKINDWLQQNVKLHETYVEIIDCDNLRTRIYENGKSVTIKKEIVDSSRLLVVLSDNIVPMVKRECSETIYTKCNDQIKRLCQTRVFKTNSDIEIKFEQIYYEYNIGDCLDPLTASKQITLHNMLKPNKPIDITTNSHLGSDEILAVCRLELEYEGALSNNVLIQHAKFVQKIESEVIGNLTITPFFSYTSIINETCYRPFVEEILITNNKQAFNDIKWFALKIDGTRGKACIVNGKRILIELDDMRMFCGDLILNNAPSLYLNNKIITVQVEYVEQKCFYITDILNVYKYKYDNKNQYDISFPINVEVNDAIYFLNEQRNTHMTFDQYKILFQSFYTNLSNIDVSVEQNDGFVGLTSSLNLVKLKKQKTYEMSYVGGATFTCTHGDFTYVNNYADKLIIGAIYEVLLIKDNQINVLKLRNDRLVSN